MEMHTILIGSDLAPTIHNFDLFKNGTIENLVGDELASIIDKADYRIYNLESALTDEVHPIKKNGKLLCAPKRTIHGIKALGANLLTLSNNHILDQNIEGLHSTISVLREHGIECIGARTGIEDGFDTISIPLGETKLGVFNCCEHEFSTLEDGRGANLFDPLVSFEQVKKLSLENNKTIVIYHGGKEFFPYPTPRLQKICRKFISSGADLVVVQHTHCVGAYETYLGKTIVYGQGDFIFCHGDNDDSKEGLLIRIQMNNSNFSIDYIPIIKCGNTILMAKGADKNSILNGFNDRSAKIADHSFLEEKFREYAIETLPFYASCFLGIKEHPIFKIVKKIGWNSLLIHWMKRSSKTLLQWENHVECETHRELLLTGIREFLKR